MAETNQNFSMYQGETKNLVVNVTKEDGTALDLTGSTVTWALRQRMSSMSNLITKSTPNQITISSNTLTVHLIPSDTTSLKGSFYHECKMTDTSGNVSELFTGLATITVSEL
jgi:hypothetical protein